MSVLFAALVAASLVVSSNPAGDAKGPLAGVTGAAAKRSVPPRRTADLLNDPDKAMQDESGDFLAEFTSKANPKAAVHYSFLFVTAPDPIETHLAASFDHNIAALQDAIQDSGYVFDSSWIPWESVTSYERLADELDSAKLQQVEHEYPGILLFRFNSPYEGTSYSNGLIVFLLADKPTAGISQKQFTNALEILSLARLTLDDTVRIVGPSFSGSLSSVVPLLQSLQASLKPSPRFVSLRSGSVTGDAAAEDTLTFLQARFPSMRVDFGSAQHPNSDLINSAIKYLTSTGVQEGQITVLAEDESSFGSGILKPEDDSARPSTRQRYGTVPFPRDISTLRASYEKQGLLEKNTPAENIKRYLHLAPEEEKEGDSIRQFGAEETVEAQESILFGISTFLHHHAIRAVVLAATSEEDRYFLARFVHENNPGVRVLILGDSRLFLRGSTSQFRGDMMLGSYPMLPRLPDWSSPSPGPNDPPSARIFADDDAEGTYMAARDLLWADALRIYPHPPPEYFPPHWENEAAKPPQAYPPVYLVALGGGSAWPLTMTAGDWFVRTGVEMPFSFAEGAGGIGGAGTANAPAFSRGGYWITLVWMVLAFNLLYAGAIVYAQPVSRRRFAYLYPAATWRYWVLAVMVPGLAAGTAFLVLAWADRLPDCAMDAWHHRCWSATLGLSCLTPLLIAVVALGKGLLVGILPSWRKEMEPSRKPTPDVDAPRKRGTRKARSIWNKTRRYVACVIPALICAAGAYEIKYPLRIDGRDASSILNSYREVHWESGLSLVPSALLLALALFAWAHYALNGSFLLEKRWHLPWFTGNERISESRGKQIADAGQPIPRSAKLGYWLAACGCALVLALLICFWKPFVTLTSLENQVWTQCGLWFSYGLVVLMLLDLFQFASLWAELRGLLHALAREPLRRSFVPLRDFRWSTLWSFSSGSFEDLRNLLAAQFDCLKELERLAARESSSNELAFLSSPLQKVMDYRRQYSRNDLQEQSVVEYYANLRFTYIQLEKIGKKLGAMYRVFVEDGSQTNVEQSQPPQQPLQPQPVIVNCSCGEQEKPFADERREVACLPPKEKLIERFLCLVYVGFIQTVIARLRTLVFSVVSVFSLVTLSLTVYPFQPVNPLLGCALGGLVLIAVVAFIVYSQMDRDPILSRILDSDPTKLEFSFYGKFFETMAPPALALLSTLLPGGAGRIIDVLRSVMMHGQ
jgi:hypothetical protein